MCPTVKYVYYPDAAAQTLRSGQVWTSVVKKIKSTSAIADLQHGGLLVIQLPTKHFFLLHP
jgi:hypothetical protein